MGNNWGTADRTLTGREQRQWRTLRKEVLQDKTCHLCGNIPYLNQASPVADAVDHLVGWQESEELRFALTNLAPAHSWCNSVRGGINNLGMSRAKVLKRLAEKAAEGLPDPRVNRRNAGTRARSLTTESLTAPPDPKASYTKAFTLYDGSSYTAPPWHAIKTPGLYGGMCSYPILAWECECPESTGVKVATLSSAEIPVPVHHKTGCPFLFGGECGCGGFK